MYILRIPRRELAAEIISCIFQGVILSCPHSSYIISLPKYVLNLLFSLFTATTLYEAIALYHQEYCIVSSHLPVSVHFP